MTNGGRMGLVSWCRGGALVLACLCGVAGCGSSGAVEDLGIDSRTSLPEEHGLPDSGPPLNSSGWFTGLGGVEFYSSCEAQWIDVVPCGAIDEQPFYGFYDGCNWCACGGNGQVGCTARACSGVPDAGAADADAGPSDAGVEDPDAWNPGLCTIDYYGLPLAPDGSEEWICDDEGRVFRSDCLPAGVGTAP